MAETELVEGGRVREGGVKEDKGGEEVGLSSQHSGDDYSHLGEGARLTVDRSILLMY